MLKRLSDAKLRRQFWWETSVLLVLVVLIGLILWLLSQ